MTRPTNQSIAADIAAARVLELDDKGRALLSPAQACAVIGICPTTLYGIMRSGKLPFLHVAGRTKIAVSDVASYIAREREGATMRTMPWDREKIAPRKRWPRKGGNCGVLAGKEASLRNDS
jgi:hypothetical protein